MIGLKPSVVHTRRHVFEQLRAKGLGVNVHYLPVHQLPYYQALGFAGQHWPAAEAYYDRAISIPMYASLTDAQQLQVVATLTEVLTA